MVSIICLCYNHANFIEEALNSVFNQSYKNWELIIINDASTDNSQEIIDKIVKKNSSKNNTIQSIHLEKNQGNCAAFNEGFKISKGKYIIDLAADDKFEVDKLEKQVRVLENADSKTGICFTNATLINEEVDEENNKTGNYYFDWYKKKPKDGFIFKELIRAGGMICSPTMLIKREVLQELGGYDESLSYEDYDFWVRSSRNWKYVFLDENLTFYRKTNHSHSSTFKKKNNPHLYSTFKICQKGFYLCKNKEEYKSLSISVLYHFKESLKYKNYKAAKKFFCLFGKLTLKII
ncbi:glycosyl transferase [Bernardetia litoralis DSM 6794]|uniref:Glycosyl transferase n=1 Tax=Bernardetia litoralis (strain ATCC 23117 / DSM 6794 / NBRC 15988 / NCIMB 1366 / Fx l1 / Sio-4) TaxID=880071 RepID=I4AMY2_BERLS|nr:glycosyltransferase [Bernardetia litoralis]AFM05317.1 glycosyl transferase [Bernardetia litoralis DSM 6794]